MESLGGMQPARRSTAAWVRPVQERLRSRREAADPLSSSRSPRPSPRPVHMARFSVWRAEPLLAVLLPLRPMPSRLRHVRVTSHCGIISA